MTPERIELTGWGEIAEHLGVSVRTAQVYERDQCLPVHRLPGPKGRVWATASELDAWRQNPQPGEITADEAVPSVPGKSANFAAEPEIATPDRRQWLRSAALGTAALGIMGTGIALGAKWVLRPAPVPADCRIGGDTLITLGSEGREIWRHVFPRRLDEGFYKNTPGRYRRFADLNGDGRIETLFICYPEGDPPEPYLACFNDQGKLLWRFQPSGTVGDTIGRQFLPPYFINDLEVVPLGKGRQSKIVVACAHHFSFPTQVAMLDYRGNLLSCYWHRGHVTHVAIADLDGSGEPAVLLGGVNDAADYKMATLLVLDHRTVSGSSVAPNGTPYFSGMGRGTEKIEVFFPKTRVSEHKEFNRVTHVRVNPNRIGVDVAEDTLEADPYGVVYELDFQFNVTDIAFGDSIRSKYAEMLGDSRRAEAAVREDEERCRKNVRVIKRT